MACADYTIPRLLSPAKALDDTSSEQRAHEGPGMKLSALIALIEDRSPYPLTSVRRTPTGYIAEIGQWLPDGDGAGSARTSIMINSLELHLAMNDAMALHIAETRIRHAVATLDRYIASLVPAEAPKWDQLAWGS